MTRRVEIPGPGLPRPQGRTPAPSPRVKAAIAVSDDGAGTHTLRLYDAIDSWGGDWGVSAKDFAAALDQVPADAALRMHVNSPGGDVFEGIAILNQLRAHPAPVTVVVDGIAASIASVIAMGGDELLMAPNSELMIHDAWGFTMGNAADMTKTAEILNHLSDNIAGAYAARAGGDIVEWRARMIAETWYAADEAVTAGLADDLVDAPAQAMARHHLIGNRYAGRAQAPSPQIKHHPAASVARAKVALLRAQHRKGQG